MPKASPALDALPGAGAAALRRLGADLTTARKRRKQSLREWSQRMSVSVPTLMRMEKGDPAVSAGIYASALWLIGRHEALAELADPQQDLAALENDVREARDWYRRREASVLPGARAKKPAAPSPKLNRAKLAPASAPAKKRPT